MSPHLEHRIGYTNDIGSMTIGAIWKSVPNTQHFTGDTVTNNSITSHQLASDDPENYREVADIAGDVCDGFNQFHLLDNKYPHQSG